jgi:hypothetical protein
MTEFRLPKQEFYHRQHEIYGWCVLTFGTRNKLDCRWFIRFAFGDQFVSFAREEDASMFALYWL